MGLIMLKIFNVGDMVSWIASPGESDYVETGKIVMFSGRWDEEKMIYVRLSNGLYQWISESEAFEGTR